MKDFLLDSTYKDATIINSNDDIFITSSNDLPSNPLPHHTIDLNKTKTNHTSNKSNKFSNYNIIDCL